MGNLLDVLLAVEGHEVEGQLLELVGPVVVALQVLLQPLPGELRQHDLGQPHVVDLEAAPQRVDALHAQVQRQLAHEGGLAAARRTWQTDRWQYYYYYSPYPVIAIGGYHCRTKKGG